MHGRTGVSSFIMQSFFDKNPHAALMLDEGWRVVQGNEAAEWLVCDGRWPRFEPVGVLERLHAANGGAEHDRAALHQLRLVASDGSSRVVDASVAVMSPEARAVAGACYVVVLVDASPPEQSLLECQEADHPFAASTELAPILVWMSGTHTRCEWFNRSWLEFRGRTMGEELGEGWTEGVHPEDLERCLGIHTHMFEAREAFVMDYRLKRHDGVYRWMLDSGSPRYGKDGAFLGYIGNCMDITDRKELENKLADRSRARRLSNRRRVAFLAKLSRRLGGPLAPIAYAAARLRTLEGGSSAIARVRELLERQVKELGDLETDLLDITRTMKA